MSAWPQISVATWLVVSMCSAIGAAAKPATRCISINPAQQRIAAAAFGCAALAEATLLWLGGFWSH